MFLISKDQKLFNGSPNGGGKLGRSEKVNGTSTSPSHQQTNGNSLANGMGSVSINGDESEENVTMLPPPKAGFLIDFF